jgi:membrane protein implicated in regulation of membrane protease activity
MTWRSIVWCLIGGPYVFALMLAPGAFVAALVALPFYLLGGGWQLAFASTAFATALVLAVYLTRLVIQHEKELDDGRTY